MKKILQIFLIIIVLAIGIFLGYYLSKNSKGQIANNLDNGNVVISENNNSINDETTSNENDFIITYEEEDNVVKTQKGFIAMSNKRNIPKVVSEKYSESAEKIEKELVDISNKLWNEANENADEYALDMNENLDEDSPVGVSYIITNGFKNDKIITFNIETIGSMGGATWDNYAGYNFDIKTGERLSLEDLAKDYNSFKKFIVEEMEKSIKEQGILEEVKEYISIDNGTLESKLIEYEERGNWYFEDDKFIIAMPKYSIGYGAMGLISTNINIDDINDYLKDKYKF